MRKGRRGRLDITMSHTPGMGAPQTGEELYCRGSLLGVTSEPHVGLPSQGVLHQEVKPPEHLALKVSRALFPPVLWDSQH